MNKPSKPPCVIIPSSAFSNMLQNPYVLIIQNCGLAINTPNIDFTTMPIAGLIATKTDNTANNKQPLNIQCGRARILIPVQQPQSVEAIIEVQFPEIFNGGIKPVVLCTFSGYTGNAADKWTDSPIPDWAGAAIAAVGTTNSSFKARIRRFDGATLLGAYYFNWVAIG
nr:MAG TPA: hypothetical protein [Caudoviricetes sp.]